MIWRKFLLFASLTLLIGGCSFMDRSQDSNENEDDKKEEVPTDYTGAEYVPVQEYDGTGYKLSNSNPKNGEVAEANREEVEKAVKEYFSENYKVEVEMHNIVSAVDGVTVYVESIGEPHFYSYAIVPIDLKNEEVMTDKVWSQEGEVEKGVRGGLYVMVFQEQFDKLDQLLEEIAEKYSLVG